METKSRSKERQKGLIMDIVEKLLEKSQEAFISGIELYNKPTIKYRIEGFSFFICNAWELLLKAYLIKTKGNQSIYYKNNPDRTITLENCLEQTLTNDKDPRRINLNRIIKLRNTSTHFITEEYETIYVPLFQACVLNYINWLMEHFNIDITEKLGSNFLTLSVKLSAISETEIKAKYPKEIADKLIAAFEDISSSIGDTPNPNYAIKIRHDWYLTKKESDASTKVVLTKEAEKAAYILKETKDMHAAFPYTYSKCLDTINRWIKKENIPFVNPKNPTGPKNVFNNYHLDLFLKFYNIKNNPNYCYKYYAASVLYYNYNEAFLRFVFEEIKKNPGTIIQDLKASIAKNKS